MCVSQNDAPPKSLHLHKLNPVEKYVACFCLVMDPLQSQQGTIQVKKSKTLQPKIPFEANSQHFRQMVRTNRHRPAPARRPPNRQIAKSPNRQPAASRGPCTPPGRAVKRRSDPDPPGKAWPGTAPLSEAKSEVGVFV